MGARRGGSRRCSLHNIDYPAFVRECLVPDCDEPLSYFSVPHDPDWRAQVEYHAGRELAAEDPGPLPDADCEPVEFKGLLWLSHDALIGAGYRCLEDFSFVLARGAVYELQGHVGRSGPFVHPDGEEGGAWWVERVRVPDEPPTGW